MKFRNISSFYINFDDYGLWIMAVIKIYDKKVSVDHKPNDENYNNKILETFPLI